MAADLYPNIYLYKRLVQAKLFMDAHYADTIDLHQIADEAYFSKFHFIRLFKKIYGKTPHQYLIAVRVDKAMHLLRQGIPVSETCFAVGFESISSFSGLFKRLSGMTPSNYFRQQQEHLQHISKTPLHFIPGCFSSQHGWSKNSNFGEVIV